LSRYEQLKSYLRQYPKALVAFSGGIDSYLVLKSAIDALGSDNILAVTGDSPSLKENEKKQTSALAEKVGARHKIIVTEEMQNPDYYNNPDNRCFFCKDELYSKLDELKNELHYDAILDGTNFDDLSDYRPGFQASRNHSVISPLAELKFTKQEIRNISKELGLEIWDKPSSPCLSSRIPYGQKVTIEKLRMIEQAENILSELGLKDFRVRHFEFPQNGKTLKLAKIDIAEQELDKFLSSTLGRTGGALKSLGYDFVTLDLASLRPGSLNVKIEMPEKFKNH